jgi:2-keto-4-pentenoate hydratase/2-oxohepta-3-ene-1,7-dioic acid hydratase in catechol pathway
MWLTVNGETRQKGSTANMIFGVSILVSYISGFMTLLPGDIISTGTPAGVGLGMKPSRATSCLATSSRSGSAAWEKRGRGWWSIAGCDDA